MREDARRVEEKLSCNSIITARRKQKLFETWKARKCAAKDRLIHSSGLHYLLSIYTPHGPGEIGEMTLRVRAGAIDATQRTQNF